MSISTAGWTQPSKEDPNARGQLRIVAFIAVRDDRIIRDINYFDRQEFCAKLSNR
jgi:hypothetical protein